MSDDAFWSTAASISATLAGFSLVGMAISIGHAQGVSEWKACTRYGRKQVALGSVIAFTFFDILLLGSPALWALLRLEVRPGTVPQWVIPSVRFIGFIAAVVVAYAIWEQIRYLGRLNRFRPAEPDSERRKRRARYIPVFLLVLAIIVLIGFGWVIRDLKNHAIGGEAVRGIVFAMLAAGVFRVASNLGLFQPESILTDVSLGNFAPQNMPSWKPPSAWSVLVLASRSRDLSIQGRRLIDVIEKKRQSITSLKGRIETLYATADKDHLRMLTALSPEQLTWHKTPDKPAPNSLLDRILAHPDQEFDKVEEHRAGTLAAIHTLATRGSLPFGEVRGVDRGVRVYLRGLTAVENLFRDTERRLRSVVEQELEAKRSSGVGLFSGGEAQQDLEVAGATPVPNAGSGISIVVPTHGRVALVGRLLDSLAAATAGLDGAAEVIVVDSSTGVDAAAIRESCRAAGARYEVGDTSVRRKRNRGIELAEQPIVLFIDSDCAATPTLISEHLRGYDDPRVAGVAGVTRFTGRDSWLWRVIERTSFLDSFSFAARERSLPWAPTCNVSYRREVLRAVDGFHTAFPFRLGADDVDLGLRVTAAGHLIRGNPAAVVEHARETWSGVGLMAWRAFRWGRMHVHLHARHPERVFADFPRWPVLFLLVGIVAMAVAVLRQRPAFLLAPLAWGALALAFEALLAPPVLGARWRDVPLELAARLLGLVYEAGTTVEALRLGRFPVLVREVSYTPPSLRGRNRRIAQVWGAVLALLALLAAGWLACA